MVKEKARIIDASGLELKFLGQEAYDILLKEEAVVIENATKKQMDYLQEVYRREYDCNRNGVFRMTRTEYSYVPCSGK